MTRILKFIDSMSRFTGKLFSFLALAIIFVIMYEVVARYFFDAPTVWATEATAMFCGIFLVMGGAYVLEMNGHVNVDIIYSTFSRRKKALADILTSPLVFLYFIVITYTGGVYALEAWEFKETTGTVANLPVYPIKIAFFIAALLMTLQMIAKFIRDLKTLFKPKENSL